MGFLSETYKKAGKLILRSCTIKRTYTFKNVLYNENLQLWASLSEILLYRFQCTGPYKFSVQVLLNICTGSLNICTGPQPVWRIDSVHMLDLYICWEHMYRILIDTIAGRTCTCLHIFSCQSVRLFSGSKPLLKVA